MVDKSKERIGDTFVSAKGGILTVIGVSDTMSGRSHKHLVTCSICSKDKELFPEPFEIRYAKLSKGQSPCGCSTYRYSEEQLRILINRKCKQIDVTFCGFVDRPIMRGEMRYMCDHEMVTLTVDRFLNKIQCGCHDCAKEKSLYFDIDKGNFPNNVEKVFYDGSSGIREYYYKCKICSHDWFTLNGYCSGVFKFLPHRLEKGFMSCRCSTKFKSDNNFKIGKAIKAKIDNGHNHIEIIDVIGDNVKFRCSLHGEGLQDYSSCLDGKLPKCCTKSGWSLIRGREEEDDFLYIMKIYYEDEVHIKIGRSFDIRRREYEIYPYETDLLYFITLKHKYLYKYEKFYHKVFSQYRVTPSLHFLGETEVFSIDILDDPDYKLLIEDLVLGY